MIAVGVQATPGPSTRAPHARVPTFTSHADGTNGRPYGLSTASGDPISAPSPSRSAGECSGDLSWPGASASPSQRERASLALGRGRLLLIVPSESARSRSDVVFFLTGDRVAGD